MLINFKSVAGVGEQASLAGAFLAAGATLSTVSAALADDLTAGIPAAVSCLVIVILICLLSVGLIAFKVQRARYAHNNAFDKSGGNR